MDHLELSIDSFGTNGLKLGISSEIFLAITTMLTTISIDIKRECFVVPNNRERCFKGETS